MLEHKTTTTTTATITKTTCRCIVIKRDRRRKMKSRIFLYLYCIELISCGDDVILKFQDFTAESFFPFAHSLTRIFCCKYCDIYIRCSIEISNTKVINSSKCNYDDDESKNKMYIQMNTKYGGTNAKWMNEWKKIPPTEKKRTKNQLWSTLKRNAQSNFVLNAFFSSQFVLCRAN